MHIFHKYSAWRLVFIWHAESPEINSSIEEHRYCTECDKVQRRFGKMSRQASLNRKRQEAVQSFKFAPKEVVLPYAQYDADDIAALKQKGYQIINDPKQKRWVAIW